MRVVVMVDAISLRVGRCRIAPEDLFQIFREVLLPGQPGYCAKDTRGGLYTMWKLSPRHSPGTCRPSELSSALQSFVVDLLRHICIWPLGLKPSCFLSNTAPAGIWFQQNLIADFQFSTLLHQQWYCSQILAEPDLDLGCSFYCSGHYRSATTGHWVGQLVSHKAPSGVLEVPVWVMGILQCK